MKCPDIAWDERIRLYNSHVSGNAELLSVQSGAGIEESPNPTPNSGSSAAERIPQRHERADCTTNTEVGGEEWKLER